MSTQSLQKWITTPTVIIACVTMIASLGKLYNTVSAMEVRVDRIEIKNNTDHKEIMDKLLAGKEQRVRTEECVRMMLIQLEKLQTSLDRLDARLDDISTKMGARLAVPQIFNADKTQGK